MDGTSSNSVGMTGYDAMVRKLEYDCNLDGKAGSIPEILGGLKSGGSELFIACIT